PNQQNGEPSYYGTEHASTSGVSDWRGARQLRRLYASPTSRTTPRRWHALLYIGRVFRWAKELKGFAPGRACGSSAACSAVQALPAVRTRSYRPGLPALSAWQRINSVTTIPAMTTVGSPRIR